MNMKDKSVSNNFSEVELRSAVGLTRWQQLSPLEVETALAIQKVEIESADISTIFGPGSDSIKANLVALRSRVRYALLRQRAVKEGLLAV
jgi:hypothetical protein